MSRSTSPEDYQLRWQSFLIDGLAGWLPAATVAASNMVSATPRDVLKGMIHDFYYPDGSAQTVDEITGWMESFARTTNAVVRDPVTGERIGNMRDMELGADGKYRLKAK